MTAIFRGFRLLILQTFALAVVGTGSLSIFEGSIATALLR